MTKKSKLEFAIEEMQHKGIEAAIEHLAGSYSAELETRMDKRKNEMKLDNKEHYLVYRVLGISAEEGDAIDLYQNEGRFLYKYAGSFMEDAAHLCFVDKYGVNNAKKVKIPNTIGKRPKQYEIDCLVNSDAHEIKWRDATTDGDHVLKENTRIKVIKNVGYIPIRVMFFRPNREQSKKIQDTLETLYHGIGGKYYAGDAAWQYIHNYTGVNLKEILERIATENERKKH